MKKITTISLLSLFFTISLFSQNIEAKSVGFEYPTVGTEVYSPDSIKAELESLIKQIRETHPNLSMIVDYDELLQVKNDMLNQITTPMNQLDIFRLFSLLNPVLSDAHNGIMLPKYKDQIKEATKLGDRLFPLHVFIDKDFRLIIKTASHGLASGTVIQSINGIDAIEITKKLEQHTRGDNTDFRRNLLADRFAEHLWMHFGSAQSFELGIKEGEELKNVTVDGSIDLLPHRRNDLSFEDVISFELFAENQIGYLKTNTFWLPDGTDEWFVFTDSVFEELRNKGSKYLIIDIRKNGGGDDQLWIEGIMPYIAKEKWQRMTHFLGRVREIDEAYPGRLGEVAIFDYYGEYEVSEKPKFEGEVYVIVGRKTYSSAIMFTSVIKDNQLGKIVGQEAKTLARGCSTGMFISHEMKTSGLDAFTPQHWYQRNTEGSCMTGIPVDIQLSDNPLNEQEIVESLVRQLTNE